jgi:transposase InsO family protein
VEIALFLKLAIGWAMDKRMKLKLVCDALQMALWRPGKCNCDNNAYAESFFLTLKVESICCRFLRLARQKHAKRWHSMETVRNGLWRNQGLTKLILLVAHFR